MTSPATPRSTARPHWLSLLTLTACLLAALTGSLTLGERATAGDMTIIDVSATQSSYTGVNTVYVFSSVMSFGLSHSGTCELALIKLGRGAIGKVTILKEGTYATPSQSRCDFAVPRSNLSSGSWTIRVRFLIEADGVDITGYESIYVT